MSVTVYVCVCNRSNLGVKLISQSSAGAEDVNFGLLQKVCSKEMKREGGLCILTSVSFG